jgi:predicted regulator of Ras-like GTPase activity (Roadblock/LC7/MglB family)
MSINELLQQIEEEIPGYEAAIAGELGGPVLGSHQSGQLDLAAQAASLDSMVSAYHDAYDGLGGILSLGGNDEILVTTSKHYLLTRLDHERKRFLTVAIAASGNIGYLRIKMKRYLVSVLAL